MKTNRVQELYRQYVGGMKQWQIKLAIARMMHFRVPKEAWQDTMQELAIVIHEFTFDADKAHAASEETILCRLMDNRIRVATHDRLGQMTQAEEDMHTPDNMAAKGELLQLFAALTPLQQTICRGLMNGMSKLEIAAATGRHYTTICRQVRHIRRAFTDGGFDQWFA